MIDNLCSALKRELELEKSDLEDLLFIKSLINIILNNKVEIEQPIYTQRVFLKDSIKESLEFLNNIDSKYCILLKDIIENKYINYNYDQNKVSNFIYKDNKKKINLAVAGNISDSYSLTHEFFHYNNIDINNITSNWYLITELLSMVAEIFQKEYFEKNGTIYKEYTYNEMYNYLGVLEKTYMLDFEIKILEIYMKHKFIDKNTIHYLLEDKDDIYINAAFYDIYEITNTLTLNYPELQKYVISGVLSSHLLSIYNKNSNYDLFKYLNDNCNKMTFVETLETMSLSLVDKKYVILSDNSLKILEEEHKERIYSLIK